MRKGFSHSSGNWFVASFCIGQIIVTTSRRVKDNLSHVLQLIPVSVLLSGLSYLVPQVILKDHSSSS